MKDLSIQFQPGLAPGLDAAAVRDRLRDFAAEGLAARVHVDEGDGGGRYVNVTYSTADLRGLWSAIDRELLNDPVLGDGLRRSTIIVCEGDHNWDDYLLLHHFDPAEPLDVLPG